MKLASKSKNRLELLDVIQEGITVEDTTLSVEKIKQLAYPSLLEKVSGWVTEKKGFSGGLAKEKAKTMIKFDSNKTTGARSMHFMGTTNKPTLTVESAGIKVAIEFIKGDRGSDLREAIGQSMIYSTAYDFVMCVFLDSTDDKRIKGGSSSITEHYFLNNLWDNFNVKFTLV